MNGRESLQAAAAILAVVPDESVQFFGYGFHGASTNHNSDLTPNVKILLANTSNRVLWSYHAWQYHQTEKGMMVHLKQLIETFNEGQPDGADVLTQKGLAAAVGTSEAHVSRHINGESQMTFETALRYAQFFGVRVSQVDDRFDVAENWQHCQPERHQ